MRVLAVVCPNGLGHYRRVVGILRRVAGRVPRTKVSIACSRWQVDRLERELSAFEEWHHAVDYLTDVTDPGVDWALAHDGYSDGRLIAWEQRLAALALDHYDAVLSDNLTGVLAYRPDAVLAGSFLWSDVLECARPDDPHARTFVERERQLLAQHRPPMICVGALATPGVLARTVPICCEAMCEHAPPAVPPLPTQRPVRVALLGGATDAAHGVLDRVGRMLSEQTDFQIAVSADTLDRLGPIGSGRLVPFGFTPDDYQTCHAIIARPGMGTLQDAIAAGRPLLCAYEQGHAEMVHLGSRVERLGFGRDLMAGFTFGISDVKAAVEEAISASARASFAEARAALGTRGLDQAAAWFAAWLSDRAAAGRTAAWVPGAAAAQRVVPR